MGCEWCGGPLNLVRDGARFCSKSCANQASRARRRPLPKRICMSPRWVRWVRSDGHKVPLATWGRPASVTDSSSWASFGDVSESPVGDGMGFVLGEGIGCFDLDHVLRDGVLDPVAARFLAEHPGWLVEVSPSGDGLHIWVDAEPGCGWKREIDGISVEFYSDRRFMTVTGVRYVGVRSRGRSSAS